MQNSPYATLCRLSRNIHLLLLLRMRLLTRLRYLILYCRLSRNISPFLLQHLRLRTRLQYLTMHPHARRCTHRPPGLFHHHRFHDTNWFQRINYSRRQRRWRCLHRHNSPGSLLANKRASLRRQTQERRILPAEPPSQPVLQFRPK